MFETFKRTISYNAAVLVAVATVMVCMFTVPVYAASAAPLLVDNANLLTDGEAERLTSALQMVEDSRECEVIIVTVDSLEGKSAESYADDYYDENGYGYGSTNSGILFLISMGEREWAMSTAGEAIYAFNDDRLSAMEDDFLPYLSDGDYYTAFSKYVVDCDKILATYNAGGYETPQIIDRDAERAQKAGTILGVGGIMSALVGLIVVLVQKRGMKNVGTVNHASYYTDRGALKLKRERDVFLYKNVNRVRRDTDSSGGGRSSGGGHSTVHHSSGGVSHGGSHGRF